MNMIEAYHYLENRKPMTVTFNGCEPMPVKLEFGHILALMFWGGWSELALADLMKCDFQFEEVA